MKFSNVLAAAAIGVVGLAGSASAVTFTIEPGDVTVSGLDFCAPGDCTLEGSVTGDSFNLDSVGESHVSGGLFDWNVFLTNPWGTGVGGYTVSVTLNFSDPSAASAGGSGFAGFVTVLGSVSAGALTWTSGSGSVAFAGGYVLDYLLHDAAGLALGTGASTGATFTLSAVPAAVPLPAGGLLLVGALGGFAALRRRRKA